MVASHLLALGSIVNKRGGILVAMRHNKRTYQSERGATANIDATKSWMNYSLTPHKTPEEIATHAKVQMLKAGIEAPRKNAVLAVELVFSLPNDRHSQNTKPFFLDCHEWVKHSFSGELLAFDVHLDEAMPHAHAVILPLIDGKMQGDKLKGDRENIKRLQNKFHDEVARKHGLSKSVAKRLSASDKQDLEYLVLERLKSDPAMLSSVWTCFRNSINRDPLPYAEMLSVKLNGNSHQKDKTFVAIMTSKGKGNNTNPDIGI